MVKIPTFDSEFKKRTGVTDAYTGYSGGEIQVASQRTNIDTSIFKTAATFEKYDNIKKERVGKVWLSKSKSDIQMFMVTENERIKKENPNLNADGHTKLVIESFKAKSDEIKKNAPSKWASDNWEINHNALLSVEFANATRYEATASVNADIVGIDEAAKAATQVVIAKPHLILEKIKEIEELFSTYDNPNTKEIEGYAGKINISKLRKKKKAIIGQMVKDTIESIIQRGDPTEIAMAKKWLDGTFFNANFQKHLNIDDQQSLIKQLNNKKIEVDGAFVNEVNSQREKNLNSVMTTGVVQFADVEDNLIALHGEKSKQVDNYRRDVKMALTIYNKSNEAYTANSEDQIKIIEELKEIAMTGDKRDSQILQQVSQNIEIFQKMIRENPVAWAKEYRPKLYEKLQTKVEPGEDGSEEAFATRQAGYKELIEYQESFGIDSWNLKIVSDDQAEHYATQIKEFSDAQAAINFFMFLKQEHGEEYFPILLDQMIQSKQLSPAWDAALQYLNSPLAENVVKNGILIKHDESKFSPNEAAEVKAIKEDIKTAFEPIRLALTQHNNNAVGFVEGWIGLLENYAIDDYMRNKNKRAAKDTFKKLVEDKFIVSEQGVLIEKSSYIDDKGRTITFEKEDFDDGLKTFINEEIPKMTFAPMKQGGTLDSEEMIPYDEWHEKNASGNVYWRNTPDGSGVELVWSNSLGTWPVEIYALSHPNPIWSISKDKQKVVLSWDDLNKYIWSLKNYELRMDKELTDSFLDIALKHRGYK